jgi:hypothetical protein
MEEKEIKTKKKKVTKKTTKEAEIKRFKNISSFRRAMTQIDIKSGDTAIIYFDDGKSFEVKSL